MDVSPMLVADLQAPEAVEPGERPFDHPAVASQAVLGLDTTAGDAGDDAALAQGQTEVTVVVTLVGMELVRSATGPAARLGADVPDRREAAISGNKKSSSNRESPHSLLILTRDIRQSQISINSQALFLRARSKVEVLG
jgi:hypothetical protein